MRRKPPTMVDVAKLANVAPMTVSRALKDDGAVSRVTRARVRAAAEELGYVLDGTAAGLSSRKSGFVAMLIPSLDNANFAATFRAMSERIEVHNLQILLGNTNYLVEQEEKLIAQMLTRRPEALVVTGGTHTDRARRLLNNAGVPVVETWDLPPDPIDTVVGFSNAETSRLVVDHFIDRGYRKIGYIGGDTLRDTRGHDRKRGFVQALEQWGLSAERTIPARPPITMQEGALAMRRLLEQWPDTRAVMCVSDLAAFGALTECQRKGIRVPQDIAIAGFGAYDISAQCVPSITTIDVNAAEIGAQTAEVIVRMLKTEGLQQEIRLKPRLVIRDSS
ncbi:LacI family DNA-binding transcriptional regulator [Pelagibacterium montanilacus]|uniref:LacI family DNA-binding transcriptional regulator n=1 Tax=Pelagibacterium montanilacus TaxID=2185280 RepID=UPI001FEB0512|nr:LacI family DNA-binding transcriptional regulator [Pelagibacterium montanilacus]